MRRDTIRAEASDAASALDRWFNALIDWAGTLDGLPETLRASAVTETSPLGVTCQ